MSLFKLSCKRRIILGIANIISRLLIGVLATLKCINVIVINATFTVFTSITLIILIMCIVLGINVGGIFTVKYYVFDIIVGKERMALASWWSHIFQSVGYFLGCLCLDCYMIIIIPGM